MKHLVFDLTIIFTVIVYSFSGVSKAEKLKKKFQILSFCVF